MPDNLLPQVPKARKDDDPSVAAVYYRARTYERARTIFIAVLASGIVALFIGRAIEADGYNDQRSRNVTNCKLIQEGIQQDADTFRNIWETGIRTRDAYVRDGKPTLAVRQKDLIKRYRGYELKKLGLKQDCNRVFPKRSLGGIPFIN